jgi:hypothetical protein
LTSAVSSLNKNLFNLPFLTSIVSIPSSIPLSLSLSAEKTMGRAPCCDKANVKKGPWSPEEDAKLKDYIEKHGTGGNWITLPKRVGKYIHADTNHII